MHSKTCTVCEIDRGEVFTSEGVRIRYLYSFFMINTKKTSPEEITERPTTKMGYFLLVCMWIALFALGQWSFTIIRDIPVPPQGAPTCIYDIISVLDSNSRGYNYYTDFTCVPNGGRVFTYQASNDQALIGTRPVFDLRSSYTELLPTAEQVRDIFRAREPIQLQIDQVQNTLSDEQKKYSLALQEKTAGVEVVYNAPESAAFVKANEASLKPLKAQVARYDAEIASLRGKVAPSVQKLQADVKTLEKAFAETQRWWQLTVDLLQFLFAGLVFGALYTFYSRFKRGNSPHTVIFTVATFAYGILLLQVVLGSIWDIIPHVFIEKLLNFLRSFSPLLYLLQFFIPLVLVALFGWLVYRIQKRLFSRENVLKRIVSDKHCPHCNNTIDIDKAFCPLCAYEIQMECPSCHTLTIKGMPFCSNCGKGL